MTYNHYRTDGHGHVVEVIRHFDHPGAYHGKCQCLRCGRTGDVLDEYTSPYTGLCAECSKTDGPPAVICPLLTCCDDAKACSMGNSPLCWNCRPGEGWCVPESDGYQDALSGMKFCPFCGAKLPEPPVEANP